MSAPRLAIEGLSVRIGDMTVVARSNGLVFFKSFKKHLRGR